MSKRNVSFVKPPEPEFIRKLKERVGYQEGPTVNTKRENLPVLDDCENDDRDEEQPTIVVLNKGDLSAEEYYEEVKKQEETKKADLSEKIVFRKPKRESENSQDANPKKIKIDKSKVPATNVKNMALLSFQDDEDENEEQ